MSRRVRKVVVAVLLGAVSILMLARVPVESDGLVDITSDPAGTDDETSLPEANPEAPSETAGIDEVAPFSERTELRLRAAALAGTMRVASTSCVAITRGSGFVIGETLLTNRHIVEGAVEIKVDDPGVPRFVAVDGYSPTIDVAFAESHDESVFEFELAAVDPPVASPILLAGHAKGGATVQRVGVVHLYGDAADWGVGGARVMLIDTPIEGGFSGGPVLNADGDVVAMLQGQDELTGLTLAIPASELRTALEVHRENQSNRELLALTRDEPDEQDLQVTCPEGS